MDTIEAGGAPTVVLVHGAFADASSWNGVIEQLQSRGVPVTAPANPLRGISADSAYIASVLDETPGPVVAVGHSYGGAVITNCCDRREKRRWPRLRRRLRPRRRRTSGRGRRDFERQRPQQRARPPPLPDAEWRRACSGVRDRSRELPPPRPRPTCPPSRRR